MNLDMDILRLAFEITQAVITAILWLYVRNVNRHRATTEHIDGLEEKVDRRLTQHDTRITKVEERLGYVPTATELTGIRDAIASLANQVAELRGSLGAVTRTTERMNRYLMERDR